MSQMGERESGIVNDRCLVVTKSGLKAPMDQTPVHELFTNGTKGDTDQRIYHEIDEIVTPGHGRFIDLVRLSNVDKPILYLIVVECLSKVVHQYTEKATKQGGDQDPAPGCGFSHTNLVQTLPV